MRYYSEVRVVASVAVLASCWRADPPPAPPPVPVAVRAPTPKAPYHPPCPEAIRASFPWAHEIFPGCPPPPLPRGVRCDRTCAKPCRVERSGSFGRSSYEVVYDKAGRYLEMRTSGSVIEACTYKRGRIASCKGYLYEVTIERDARGRIDDVNDTLGRMVMGAAYDAPSGRVHGLYANDDRTSFEYDAAGRLVRERGPTNLAYHYDASGRVERIVEGEVVKKVRRYRYDIRDRLVEIVEDDGSTKYDYDEQGRVVWVSRDGAGWTGHFERYEYCD